MHYRTSHHQTSILHSRPLSHKDSEERERESEIDTHVALVYIYFSNDRQAGQQSTERRRGGWGRGCSGWGQRFPTTRCHGQLEEGGSNQHEGPGTGKCAGGPFLFQASNTLSWKRKLSGYHHRVGLDSYIAMPQSQALQYCSLIMPEDKATVYIYIYT